MRRPNLCYDWNVRYVSSAPYMYQCSLKLCTVIRYSCAVVLILRHAKQYIFGVR